MQNYRELPWGWQNRQQEEKEQRRQNNKFRRNAQTLGMVALIAVGLMLVACDQKENHEWRTEYQALCDVKGC